MRPEPVFAPVKPGATLRTVTIMPNCPTARLHLIVVATGLLAAAAALRPDPAHAQSFDCRQARHQDEMVICHEPALAHLDQQLATLYREQIAKIPKERQ